MKKTQAGQNKNLVGGRVRRARYNREPKMSQDALAEGLATEGVSIDRSGISKLESYQRYIMDYEVAALAKVLGVSVAWLYREEG